MWEAVKHYNRYGWLLEARYRKEIAEWYVALWSLERIQFIGGGPNCGCSRPDVESALLWIIDQERRRDPQEWDGYKVNILFLDAPKHDETYAALKINKMIDVQYTDYPY